MSNEKMALRPTPCSGWHHCIFSHRDCGRTGLPVLHGSQDTRWSKEQRPDGQSSPRELSSLRRQLWQSTESVVGLASISPATQAFALALSPRCSPHAIVMGDALGTWFCLELSKGTSIAFTSGPSSSSAEVGASRLVPPAAPG